MGKASRRKKEAAQNGELSVKEKAALASGPDKSGKTAKIIGFTLAGVLAVGIIGVAFLAKGSAQPGDVVAGTDSSAALPAGTYDSESGYAYAWKYRADANPDLPVLAIWEDFQCPACAQFEGYMGQTLNAIADEGLVNLVYRPTTFLDRNLQNDSSARAVAAWGCAIDAGKGIEFHDEVYANQPAEGAGYTEEDFITFAGNVGIEGEPLNEFKQCLADEKYKAWGPNSTAVFYNDDISGTPTVLLNGEPLSQEVFTDEAALRQAIKDVTIGVDPSTEPVPTNSPEFTQTPVNP